MYPETRLLTELGSPLGSEHFLWLQASISENPGDRHEIACCRLKDRRFGSWSQLRSSTLAELVCLGRAGDVSPRRISNLAASPLFSGG